MGLNDISGLKEGGLNDLTFQFQPDSIATLEHWYEADNISGSQGDSIETWSDREGSENLTQGTSSNQPTLQTDALNGLNTLSFDGSDDYYDVDFSSTVSQPLTVFVVVTNYDTSDTTNRAIQSGYSNRCTAVRVQGNTSDELQMDAGNQLTGSGVAMDSDPHYFTGVLNGSSSSLRQDASAVISGSAGNNDMRGLTVGDFEGPLGNYINADLAELLVYSEELSTADRDNVESYLSDKYGI